MLGPRVWSAPPRLLTVLGDTSAIADEFTYAIRLGDAIYAIGKTCLAKFDLRLRQQGNPVQLPANHSLGLATDGTYIYAAFMAFSGSYNWGVRIMRFTQTLVLDGQNALDTPGMANDYPYVLMYSGGSLYLTGGAQGNGSSTYMRQHCLKIDPVTLAAQGNKSYYGGGFDIYYGARLLQSGSILALGTVKGSKYAAHAAVLDSTLAMGPNKQLSSAALDCYFLDGVELGGSYYCVGSVGNNGLLAKFDSSMGTPLQRMLGNTYTTVINGIAVDDRGGLVICGSTTVPSSGGHYDAFVAQVDPATLAAPDQVAIGATGSGHSYMNKLLASGPAMYAFGTEGGRDALSNGMALRLPKKLSSAHVSGIGYLTAKPLALPVSDPALTVSTPTLSSATESWTSWAPGLAAPAYTTATADYGRI